MLLAPFQEVARFGCFGTRVSSAHDERNSSSWAGFCGLANHRSLLDAPFIDWQPIESSVRFASLLYLSRFTVLARDGLSAREAFPLERGLAKGPNRSSSRVR